MKKLVLPVLIGMLLLSSCGERAVTAATVNGEIITEDEVEAALSVNQKLGEFYNTPDEFPVDREGVIMDIAERMVLEQAAREVGIEIRDSEVNALIANEQADIDRGAAENDENFLKRFEEDIAMLNFLGLTREEYNEKVYFGLVKASEVNSEYAVWFYGEYGFDMDAYDAHKAELFEAAEIIIYDPPAE